MQYHSIGFKAFTLSLNQTVTEIPRFIKVMDMLCVLFALVLIVIIFYIIFSWLYLTHYGSISHIILLDWPLETHTHSNIETMNKVSERGVKVVFLQGLTLMVSFLNWVLDCHPFTLKVMALSDYYKIQDSP